MRSLKAKIQQLQYLLSHDQEELILHYHDRELEFELDVLQKVEVIQNILSSAADGIFKSLSQKDLTQVLKNTQVLELGDNHVLFRQGQKSDGYYVIVEGNVSIYKVKSNQATALQLYKNSKDDDLTSLGTLVVTLAPGMGFGDLNVVATAVELSRRTASAVCRGPAQLLFIPINTYTQYVYPATAEKREVDARAHYLQNLHLFELWPSKLLWNLAEKIRPRINMAAGHCISKLGQPLEQVYFIISGEVKISVFPKPAVEERNEESFCAGQAETKHPVAKLNVAVLGPGEIIGLCEMVHKLSHTYRIVSCLTEVVSWVIRFTDFLPIINSEPQIREVIGRVAENRMKWENLALEYRKKFPESYFPMSLKMNRICKYSTLEHITTQAEEKQINEKNEMCQKALHNARTMHRHGQDFIRRGFSSEALVAFSEALEECRVGIRLSCELGKVGQLHSITEFEKQLSKHISALVLEIKHAAAAGKKTPDPDGKVLSTMNWITHVRTVREGENGQVFRSPRSFPRNQGKVKSKSCESFSARTKTASIRNRHQGPSHSAPVLRTQNFLEAKSVPNNQQHSSQLQSKLGNQIPTIHRPIFCEDGVDGLPIFLAQPPKAMPLQKNSTARPPDKPAPSKGSPRRAMHSPTRNESSQIRVEDRVRPKSSAARFTNRESFVPERSNAQRVQGVHIHCPSTYEVNRRETPKPIVKSKSFSTRTSPDEIAPFSSDNQQLSSSPVCVEIDTSKKDNYKYQRRFGMQLINGNFPNFLKLQNKSNTITQEECVKRADEILDLFKR